ncbi:MAG: hypothetical protein QXR62_04805 [Candidatus Bathyarchaeia archaeon]
MIDISLPCVKCYTCQVCITCEKYGCQVGETNPPQWAETVPPEQQFTAPQTPPTRLIVPQTPPRPIVQPQMIDEKRIREIVIEVLIELGLIEVKGRRTV